MAAEPSVAGRRPWSGIAETARRTAARWWLVAPTLLVFVIVNQLDKTNVSVLIADRQFLADLGLVGQPGRIGFLSSAFFYGYGLSLMIWGFIVDRIGPRRSAALGVTGWALTTAWCAVAGGAREMYAARFALGLAEGCMWPVCNSYVGRWFPVREHGRIQAFWINGAQIGVAIGLPIVTALLLAGGWRAVFWTFSAGSVLLVLPMLFLLAPDEPRGSRFANQPERLFIEAHRAAAASPASAARFGQILKDTRFWLLTLCHAILVATFFGLTTWIPTYLTQVRGLSFTTMSASVAALYALPIGLALLVGYLADRTMRRAAVGAISSLVMAVMVVAAVLVPSTVLSMLLLVVSFAAPISYGAMNTAIMQALSPPAQIGRSTGIFVGLANLLGAAGPAMVGYLIGAFGGKYLVAFGFLSALNLVQAGLYTWIGRLSAE